MGQTNGLPHSGRKRQREEEEGREEEKTEGERGRSRRGSTDKRTKNLTVTPWSGKNESRHENIQRSKEKRKKEHIHGGTIRMNHVDTLPACACSAKKCHWQPLHAGKHKFVKTGTPTSTEQLSPS